MARAVARSLLAFTKITGSRKRQLTSEFLRLKSHYLFESHFCLVRRPTEKGHVENLVGYGRHNYLVPIPKVDSFEQLNAELERRCREGLQRQLRGKSQSKQALLEEERAAMLDLPRQSFDARRVTQAAANSLSVVRFDTNSYSVLVKYAHRQITLVVSVEEVRLTFQGELIARHPRHWRREQHIFDPVHYLARYFRVTELITTLIEARDEKLLLRLRSQLANQHLLILDELG